MTTIELHIRRLPDTSLSAELRAELPRSRADLGGAPIRINTETLLSLSDDPEVYGATLSAMVFPAPLREAWGRARGYAERGGEGIHVRVAIDDPTGELHSIRWELLRDPTTSAPLAQQEGGSLARLVAVEQLHDATPHPRPALRALVAVAGPSDAQRYGLAPVDVPTEARRAVEALGDIQAELLADTALATLANIRNALRNGAQLLYIVCHGRATPQGTTLYLVGDDGKAAPVSGDQLAAEIAALDVGHRPLLAVLVACEGADQQAAPLASVGPLLARAGIPAVVAVQARISMAAAAQLTRRLLSELGRDGRIDRALAAARKELGDEWWAPVLWLRGRDGRLWAAEAVEDRQRDQKLRALLHDHSGFIASRMEAFVGRAAELAEIRQRIAEKLPTGGYVTITGQAGQGKSSVIAKLVADALSDQLALRDRLLEPGAGVPVCHFIPFSPGPDHQVGLLRNLIARLCLTYRMPDFYAISDNRAALRHDFAAALRNLANQGGQEIIYIDGLDQIEEDASGVRDLSFLPEEPPEGIVFVLGTRPNDTLKPLELRKPQHEYWLHTLSRADFDLILKHRGVVLDTLLADRFYMAMQENALYLDLVARELAHADAIEPEQIIARVTDNPASLFSLSIERLQQNERQWETVLRPILGLLLAARSPLSQRALRTLIGADKLRTQRGLERLGGLIQRDGEGYYGLFHLKLGEYLRQDVFDSDEEQCYHQQLVNWCAGGKGGIGAIWQDTLSDALEQDRRGYARQHYIAHLASARAYEQLWGVVDGGEYGAAKRRYDPSTRSYALDLDVARQAVIDAVEVDADAQARTVSRLWRYSLLRCSLTSQADTYPVELFLAMVALGRGSEAMNLAELLSDPVNKIKTLQVIGEAMLERGSDEGKRVLQHVRMVAGAIPNYWRRAEALSTLTQARAAAQHPLAATTFAAAHTAAVAIPDDRRRADALGTLALALATAQHPLAAATFADAHTTAVAIPNDRDRAEALSTLALVFTIAHRWGDAHTTAVAIPNDRDRAEALGTLALALTIAHHWGEARATAEAIPDDQRRAAALGTLALALTIAQHPQAAITFADAHIIAAAIPEDQRRAEALGTLALALTIAQHPLAVASFADARIIADAIPNDRDRAEALSFLTLALATAQHLDDARIIATAIPDDQRRAEVMGALALALTTTQHLDDARIIVATVTDDQRLAVALTTIALALTTAQRWDDARIIADAIPDGQHRAVALSTLALALTTAQRWDKARATADTIPNDRDRADALSTLALALTTTQHWDDARIIADTIPDAQRRAAALSTLALALAAAQHPLAVAIFADARAAAVARLNDQSRAAALGTLAQSLTSAHRWNDAHAVAIALTNDRDRAEALSTLTLALTTAKCWDDAHTTAVAIPDIQYRTVALSTLALALTTAQHWDDARTAAAVIPDIQRRAEVLGTLALALTTAQHPLAATVFADARTAVVAIPNDRERAEALTILAQALTTARRWDDARAAATAIPDYWQRAQSLTILVHALVDAKCWDEARVTADAIPDDGNRAEVLSTLALALTIAQRPLAAATFADARIIADAIPNDQRRAEALSTLAQALTTAQPPLATATFADARVAVGAIRNDRDRAAALSILTLALTTAQRWDDARATALAIPDDQRRAETLSTLAQALTTAQHPLAATVFADARTAVVAIPNDRERAEALTILAQALTTARRWDDARAAALAIPDYWQRAQSLTILVHALVDAKCWDEARVTALTIADSQQRAAALSTLAHALTAAQHWDEAHATALAIPDESDCAEALSTLALALTTTQRRDDAWATALAIPNDRERAEALSTLALVLTTAQHPQAETAFTDARTAADAIPHDRDRAEALSTLALTLTSAQRWGDARAAATAIPDYWQRAQSLRTLALTLTIAQHPLAAVAFADARVAADAMPNDRDRVQALSILAQGFTVAQHHVEALSTLALASLLTLSVTLLTDLWRRAQTRDELLRLFIVPPELLRAYPELGREFLDSFAWVDDQLKAG